MVGEWALRRCSSCRFVFLGVQLDWSAKKAINDERYTHSVRLDSAPRKRMRERDDLECIQQIERYGSSGAMLDIGCATGDLLEIAAARGWRVSGVELDAGMGAEAKKKLGSDKIHVGTLASFPAPPASFDVIVLRSVVEHLPDPRAELARVRKLLRPGARLFVLVPNIESFESHLYGPRWFALTPGDHVWFFSPATLRRFMADSGFSCVWITTTEGFRDMFVGFFFAAWSMIRDLLRGKRSPSAAEASEESPSVRSTGSFAKQHSIRAVHAIETAMEILRVLLSPLFWAYTRVLQRTGRGASIRGIFVKTEIT